MMNYFIKLLYAYSLQACGIIWFSHTVFYSWFNNDCFILPPGILGRYPQEDHADFPLAYNLPMFCLPLGSTIEAWPTQAQHPMPKFSTFVLTQETGGKVMKLDISNEATEFYFFIFWRWFCFLEKLWSEFDLGIISSVMVQGTRLNNLPYQTNTNDYERGTNVSTGKQLYL